LTPVMLDDIAKIAYQCRIVCSANGRFLRHRPERSERCLNYERLYQGQRALPKDEGVPQA